MSQASGKKFLEFDDVAAYRIPMKKYRKRACRSTRDQHTAFVEYVEKHPYVLDPTYNGYDKLWDDLAVILNGRGPRRSVDQWQTNLRDWRYATAFKYKRAKKMGMWNLTEVEEKFLKITGRMPRDSTDKSTGNVSSDDDGHTLKVAMEAEEDDQPVLMEVTQSPAEVILEETETENPDISSVWFPETKKEIILDVEDAVDVLKAGKPTATYSKKILPNSQPRWTDKEIRWLINYVKSTLEEFEKPKPEIYYRKFLSLHPTIQRSTEFGVEWSAVKGKMTFLRNQYNQAKIWLRKDLGSDSSDKLSTTTEVQLLTKCPYFHDLDVIFGGKTLKEVAKKVQIASDGLKISLPSQITVRNVKTNRMLDNNFIPSSKSKEALEEQKLDLEIRRFELEMRKYEHEKQMDDQKFTFDSEMRKQELELRRLELENHRLEVEQMVEIEKLRFQQEERLEIYKIEMEYEIK